MNLGSETKRLAVDVELRALVAALVDLDEQPPVRQELPADRLVVVGQLLHLAALDGHGEELLRAGSSGADEQTTSVRRERERQRLPHLEQRAQIGYAVTPDSSGMMSSPYACNVSS